MTKREKELAETFHRVVVESGYLFPMGCWFRTVIPHECDGPVDACHVIDKQGLRILGKGKLKEVEHMVWDVRNGLPGCRAIHHKFDHRFIRVYQDELPDCVSAFVVSWEEALDMEGALEEKLSRKCPEGKRP